MSFVIGGPTFQKNGDVILSSHNLPLYLLDKGLIERADILDRSIRVQQRSGRHESFKFEIDGATGYFVKQAPNSPRGRRRTLSREAQFYDFAKTRGLFDDALPRCVEYSEPHQILTLEFIAGETMRDRCFFSRICSTTDARALGGLLASMHQKLSAEQSDDFNEAAFEERVPWLFTVDSVGKAIQRSRTAGQTEVGAIVQKFPEVQEAINRIKNEWTVTGLCHGDFKLENCLIRNPTEDEDVMVVVDWELAGLGDQAWDVAGALQSYVSLWVKTSRRNVKREGDQAETATGVSWQEAHRAMRAFWIGYSEGIEPGVDQRRRLLEKCISFTGVRLIQTAYEEMQRSRRIHVYAIYLLQVAYNFMLNSGKWARDILDSCQESETSGRSI